MRFKIDWASLIVGSKFTVSALFYFVFEGNFPSTSPLGAYIWKGDLTDGFLRYRFGGLVFGGAYTWRGLFSEFYGILLFPCEEAFHLRGDLARSHARVTNGPKEASLGDASHDPKAWEAKEGAVLSQVTFFAIRNKELVRRLFSSYPTYFMLFHFS